MADSKMKYCRLCKKPCDNCGVCLQNPDRFRPTNDMIQNALKKKGAFASSTFRTISSDPPEISVTDGANGDTNVAVRLTSMPFIPEYRDPWSPARKKLEKAAREEIIRSFDLPRDEVGDSDIEIDIREGSVQILIVVNVSIITIATVTIAGLCYVDAHKQKGATRPADHDLPDDPPYSVRGRPVAFSVAPSDAAHDIKTVGSGATGAVLGATAGLALGPPGIALGGAFGFIAGTIFGDTFFK